MTKPRMITVDANQTLMWSVEDIETIAEGKGELTDEEKRMIMNAIIESEAIGQYVAEAIEDEIKCILENRGK